MPTLGNPDLKLLHKKKQETNTAPSKLFIQKIYHDSNQIKLFNTPRLDVLLFTKIIKIMYTYIISNINEENTL